MGLNKCEQNQDLKQGLINSNRFLAELKNRVKYIVNLIADEVISNEIDFQLDFPIDEDIESCDIDISLSEEFISAYFVIPGYYDDLVNGSYDHYIKLDIPNSVLLGDDDEVIEYYLFENSKVVKERTDSEVQELKNITKFFRTYDGYPHNFSHDNLLNLLEVKGVIDYIINENIKSGYVHL